MHERPPNASDADVRASGLMGEAFERIERARGALYDMHQLIGGADNALDGVLEALREGGHPETADALREDLIGFGVLGARWTFELVEEFDEGFYARWQHWERRLRDELVAGRRHVYEAELKAERQSR